MKAELSYIPHQAVRQYKHTNYAGNSVVHTRTLFTTQILQNTYLARHCVSLATIQESCVYTYMS